MIRRAVYAMIEAAKGVPSYKAKRKAYSMTTIGDLIEIFKVIFDLFGKLFKMFTKDDEKDETTDEPEA